MLSRQRQQQQLPMSCDCRIYKTMTTAAALLLASYRCKKHSRLPLSICFGCAVQAATVCVVAMVNG